MSIKSSKKSIDILFLLMLLMLSGCYVNGNRNDATVTDNTVIDIEGYSKSLNFKDLLYDEYNDKIDYPIFVEILLMCKVVESHTSNPIASATASRIDYTGCWCNNDKICSGISNVSGDISFLTIIRLFEKPQKLKKKKGYFKCLHPDDFTIRIEKEGYKIKEVTIEEFVIDENCNVNIGEIKLHKGIKKDKPYKLVF